MSAITQDQKSMTTPSTDDKSTNTPTTNTASSPANVDTVTERKILILREMDKNTTEEIVKNIFTDLATTITNIRADIDGTWFVTFTSGEAAKSAFTFAMSTTHEGKPLQVRFKSITSTSAYLTQPTHLPAQQHIAPHFHQYAASPEYWDNTYQPDYHGARPRHNQPRHPHYAANGSNPAMIGAQPGPNGRQGGQPKPKTGRVSNPANSGSQHPRSSHQAGAPVAAQTLPEAGKTTPDGQPTQHRPRTSSSNRAPSSNTSTNNSQGARRNGASGDRRGPRSDKKDSNNSASKAPVAPMTLTNFPPLGPPSGTSSNPNGYQGRPFKQYNRETILGVISQRDASAIVRPEFDNSDTPILLASPQVELEINKPLPVGAKFEPLAQDKRTRSLSKNASREAPAPTAAQIVAAAAAKPNPAQPAAKKTVVATKPVAAKATAPQKKESAPEQKKPAASTTQSPVAQTATPASTTAAPAAKSWADRARTSPAAVVETKKPVVAEKKPVVAAPEEKQEAKPEVTEDKPTQAAVPVEAGTTASE